MKNRALIIVYYHYHYHFYYDDDVHGLVDSGRMFGLVYSLWEWVYYYYYYY